MSANIYSYIGRESAWHKLGTVTGTFQTWTEIQEKANLDFRVFKSQLHDGLGRPVAAWGTFRWNRADQSAGNKSAAVFLGPVGEDYTPIQHSEGFRLVDALVSSVDGAHYETAGALGNGERVWGLADLNLSLSVGDDKQTGYLLFCTGHDGSMSHQYRITLVRVVCQNTLNAALSARTNSQLIIRHTRSAPERIDKIHSALANICTDLLSVEEKLNFLAKRKLTRETASVLFDRLFPPTLDDTGNRKPDSGRRKNILGEILSLYEICDNNAFPEQRGTAYAMLNAVTEWTDHLRNRTDATARAESAVFGGGDRLKSTALEILMELAPNMGSTAEPVYVSARRIAPPSSDTPKYFDLVNQ